MSEHMRALQGNTLSRARHLPQPGNRCDLRLLSPYQIRQIALSNVGIGIFLGLFVCHGAAQSFTFLVSCFQLGKADISNRFVQEEGELVGFRRWYVIQGYFERNMRYERQWLQAI